MSGDLGNLLTGELGEAEARFAHDDFSDVYGKRVMGRVRTRRAVRVAGVGGGAALTAAALAIGSTQVPWGVLGAAGLVGVGGSDCVTPSPSDGASNNSVAISTSHGSLDEIVFVDAASGSTIMKGVMQLDGTYLFEDGGGNRLAATPGVSGYYTVELPPGASFDDTTRSISVENGGAVTGSSDFQFHLTNVVDWATPTPSRSSDCYTPSPTPSGDPSLSATPVPSSDESLAAKPEDVASPFQCGFVVDGLGHGSSQIAITGYDWVDPADFNAGLQARWPESTTLPLERGTSPIPMVRVQLDPDQVGRWGGGGFGLGDPTDDMGSSRDGAPFVLSGASFVKVSDGVVVATMDTGTRDAGQHAFLDFDGTTHELTLVNAADGFVACPGQTVDPANATIFAVAGSFVKDPSGTNGTDVDYSWAAIEPN